MHILLLSLLCSHVLGADFFVADADIVPLETASCNQTDPCSLVAAIGASEPGDRLVLGAGSYSENLSRLNRSLSGQGPEVTELLNLESLEGVDLVVESITYHSYFEVTIGGGTFTLRDCIGTYLRLRPESFSSEVSNHVLIQNVTLDAGLATVRITDVRIEDVTIEWSHEYLRGDSFYHFSPLSIDDFDSLELHNLLVNYSSIQTGDPVAISGRYEPLINFIPTSTVVFSGVNRITDMGSPETASDAHSALWMQSVDIIGASDGSIVFDRIFLEPGDAVFLIWYVIWNVEWTPTWPGTTTHNWLGDSCYVTDCECFGGCSPTELGKCKFAGSRTNNLCGELLDTNECTDGLCMSDGTCELGNTILSELGCSFETELWSYSNSPSTMFSPGKSLQECESECIWNQFHQLELMSEFAPCNLNAELALTGGAWEGEIIALWTLSNSEVDRIQDVGTLEVSEGWHMGSTRNVDTGSLVGSEYVFSTSFDWDGSEPIAPAIFFQGQSEGVRGIWTVSCVPPSQTSPLRFVGIVMVAVLGGAAFYQWRIRSNGLTTIQSRVEAHVEESEHDEIASVLDGNES